MYYRLFKLIFIQKQWLKLTQDFSDFFPGYKMPGITRQKSKIIMIHIIYVYMSTYYRLFKLIFIQPY